MSFIDLLKWRNSDKCWICWVQFHEQEPSLDALWKSFCQDCCLTLADKIYDCPSAMGWGIIHIIYQDKLSSSHNRKLRKQIPRYKTILNELLHKYNFCCVLCGAKDRLEIDHKFPVSKWWKDNICNLQIMCKSCNSRKSNKIEYANK